MTMKTHAEDKALHARPVVPRRVGEPQRHERLEGGARRLLVIVKESHSLRDTSLLRTPRRPLDGQT